MDKTYKITEIFYSLQGEGVRAGTPNFFLRFSGCNLTCAGAMIDQAYQPICDTEFVSHMSYTAESILQFMKELNKDCEWIICTGGEPALQLDQELVNFFHKNSLKVAIETNGTRNVDDLDLDWITVSPKIAEHAILQKTANEVKYVRGYGQGIPKTVVQSEHYLISPHFEGNLIDKRTLEWCVKLCKENPPWRLSLQLHKFIGAR